MAVQVQEHPFEVGFIQDFLVLGDTEEQGGATDIVNLTGDAFSVIKEAGDETVAEKLSLIAGDPQVVLDVSSGFGQVEGGQLIADGDALMEGAVGSKGEFVGQIRLAQQDEGQMRGGVEVIIEQEAELVKEVRGKR